ncbi:MAG: adenylate/guanylate cyclase domain-containing protein [Pseudobdellovibrionaceae bacterium]|nr:adenylate/guanylate cyclase domain-containing protein [Pseudobdellovibrionaceae bacterium]
MLHPLHKVWLTILLGFWIMPLHGAEPATSYDWNDRISTYRAYWDDPRPLLAEGAQLLSTLDPEQEPQRWLQVFSAYGMANDFVHETPGIDNHLRTAKRIATKLGLWELMIDTLIIEAAFTESLTPESPAGLLAEYGLNPAVPYERALALAIEHNSTRNRYLVIRNYMSYLRNNGQSTRVMQLLEHAARDVNTAKDFADIDRLNLKKNLVFLYKIANHDAGVIQLQQELAENCHTVPFRTFCTYMLYDYGVLLASGRVPLDYARAVAVLEKAEQMAAELNDFSIVSLIHLSLSQIADQMKNPEVAIRHAQQAAGFGRKVGAYAMIGDARLSEAKNLRRLTRYTEALGVLTELKKELPDHLYLQQAALHNLLADIHADLQAWPEAYADRTRQVEFEKKFLQERGQENFSEQVVRLGLQLEQEKNKALTSANELQERKRKTIVIMTLAVILIALCLLLGLVWVSRKNREIRKLNRFIETQVLQRFLPPKIVGDILAGKSQLEQTAQSRVVTILFADLVSFTASAERMQPQDLTELLNRFFADMSEVVFEHGGVIDKFIGDAIMVVFGAPQELSAEEQAEFSTRCAVGLLACLERLNEEWRQRFDIAFAMRVGIHQGPGVVGTFGSTRRSDYTVIGHTVNLASRIESQALPNQILVSETIARFLADDRKSHVGSFRLKGIEQPVALSQLKIYALMHSPQYHIRL